MSLTRNLKPHTNTGAEFPTVPALWYSMVCSHPHSLPHILHDEYMIHTCLATSYNSMSLPSFVRSQGPHGQTHTHKPRKGVRGRRSHRHISHTLTGASLNRCGVRAQGAQPSGAFLGGAPGIAGPSAPRRA